MGIGWGREQENLQLLQEDNYFVFESCLNNLKLVFMTPRSKQDPITYPIMCFGTIVILYKDLNTKVMTCPHYLGSAWVYSMSIHSRQILSHHSIVMVLLA